MNQKIYDKVISTFAKAKLGGSLKGVMDNAEVAWSAQKDATSLIDYKNEAEKGEQKLEELLDALNMWIIRLEVLENGAKEIAKRANQAIHRGGRNVEHKEDSQGYGIDEVSDEAIRSSSKRTQNASVKRRAGRRRNDRDRAFSDSNSGIGKSFDKGIAKDFNKSRKISCGE
jgi:Fe2+ transport system protein B